MPLLKSKSKKAVAENIKAEMASGKPQKQSIAIALSVQRKARAKKAQGGEIRAADGRPDASSRDIRSMAMAKGPKSGAQELDARDEHMDTVDSRDEREMQMLDSKPLKHKSELRAASGRPDVDNDEERPGSIAEAIMHKRRLMMAKGGEVDLEENAEEHHNHYDDLNEMAADHESYSEEAALEHSQPMDSNLHDRTLLDEDEHSMLGKIRAKMRSKRS